MMSRTPAPIRFVLEIWPDPFPVQLRCCRSERTEGRLFERRTGSLRGRVRKPYCVYIAVANKSDKMDGELWPGDLHIDTKVTVQDVRPGDYKGVKTSTPYECPAADYAVRGCPKQV